MDSGCHALPLTADTNSTSLGGFDVPTMRGMTDRWLQFSIGITNAEEALEGAKVPGTINGSSGFGRSARAGDGGALRSRTKASRRT